MTPVSKKRTPGFAKEKFLNWGRGSWPSQRYLNRAGTEDGAECTENKLLAAARKMRPVVFSEMSVSTSAPDDVPATYLVGVRV